MQQRHHDGHGLNDALLICCDERDPDAGNASHKYCGYLMSAADVAKYTLNPPDAVSGEFAEAEVLNIDFQHGPRDEESSNPGATDAALIAILLDRYEGFQSGPYRCRENALVITKLEEALHWMQHRANDRARRGVLGKNEK